MQGEDQPRLIFDNKKEYVASFTTIDAWEKERDYIHTQLENLPRIEPPRSDMRDTYLLMLQALDKVLVKERREANEQLAKEEQDSSNEPEWFTTWIK
jgi:hypothetical protein